jgi:hypothetical protein
MKTVIKFTLLAVTMASILFAFNGCSKADPADKVGKMIFWQSQSNAQELGNFGITSLTFTVNGNIVGSMAANVYFNAVPSCGNTGGVNANINLGQSSSKSVLWKATDQDGDLVYEETATVQADGCLQVQLQ